MENQEKFKFEVSSGSFASCTYPEMEYVLKQYGHGKWHIATTAETLQFSPFRDDAFFWTCTKNLYTPEGVIVYDDPFGKMPTDAKKLMELYDEGHPEVRFAKKGFKLGQQSISELVENPLMIAQVGNKDLMDVVASRAKCISPEKTFVINQYLQGNEKKPIRHSGIDSYGSCGQFFHLYCDIGGDMRGSIHGYMKKIN